MSEFFLARRLFTYVPNNAPFLLPGQDVKVKIYNYLCLVSGKTEANISEQYSGISKLVSDAVIHQLTGSTLCSVP